MSYTISDIEREAYQIYLKKQRFNIPEGPLNNATRNWKEAEDRLRFDDLIQRGSVGQ